MQSFADLSRAETHRRWLWLAGACMVLCAGLWVSSALGASSGVVAYEQSAPPTSPARAADPFEPTALSVASTTVADDAPLPADEVQVDEVEVGAPATPVDDAPSADVTVPGGEGAPDDVAVESGGLGAGLVAGWEAVSCAPTVTEDGSPAGLFTYRLFIADGREVVRERVDLPGSHAVNSDPEWGAFPSPIYWTVSVDEAGQVACQFA